MKGVYRETLSFSYSDIIGLQRGGIQMGQPTKIPAGTELSFGFFGDGNNMNTFYPGLTNAEFMPKPEDMVDVPFRIVSATNVGAYSWKATDFSAADVLKPSVPMMMNKPIFFDHSQNIPNWLGVTTDPYWQDSFTAVDGTKVPAGINANVRIDAKSNPKIARGLVMGAIGSISTTVQFDWVPSHNFDNMAEFYDKIGTIASDGKMVRRVATKILDYHENSLVWLGADPFAKKNDAMGNPINVDKTSVHYSKEKPYLFTSATEDEKTVYESEKKFIINFGIDDNIISLSKKENQIPPKVTLNKDKNMKQVLLAFIAAFKTKLNISFSIVDGQEMTDAQVAELTAAMTKLDLAPDATLTASNTRVIDFAKKLKLVNDKGEFVAFDIASATGEYHIIHSDEQKRVYGLAVEAGTLKPMASLGAEYLTWKRAETVRLYKLSVGDNVDNAVIATYEQADSKTLDGLLKQYAKGTTANFTATCTKCNSSDNIEMRSSMVDPVKTTQVNTSGSLSIQDMAAKRSKSNMVIGK